jgi:small conductance mechanosensitive channel
MDVLPALRDRLTDPALVPNLIATLALAVAAQVPSLVLRRLLRGCGGQLTGWIGSRRLQAVGEEATRRVEGVLFRLTLAAVCLVAIGGVVYHLIGRDVRADAAAVLAELTAEELLHIGVRLGGLAFLLVALWATIRWVRRTRTRLARPATVWLRRPADDLDLRRGLVLLEHFVVAGICLTAAWAALRVLGLSGAGDAALGLAAWLTLLLSAVRVLPLAARLLAGPAAELGDQHLGRGALRRYWERVRRLAPFGLRCFEAAVYIYAGSRALRDLGVLPFVAGYGPKLVTCITIFFGCRVAIELSQELLSDAFGLSNDERPADPKGQTLVPLLHSTCQYVLYFGAAVVMLGILGVNTGPILAGAGLLGLAVGLGAQSLVTDVVSGFFILFEGQYLVGDHVEIGDARGRVEAFSIRTTQIRDAQGKLYVIPNGQIKGVVSSSKGYINAIVDMRLPADGDLDRLLEAMREAGRRLRQQYPAEVLADTEVQALVDLGPAEATTRAVTRVRPGKNGAMERAYRALVKQVLDERPAAAPERQAA